MRHSPTINGLGALVAALLREPMTRPQMRQVTGMSDCFIRDVVRTWKQMNILHRRGMVPSEDGRMLVELFAIGPGRDAPRTPVPHSVRKKRYQASRRGKEQQLALQAALFGKPCSSTKSPEISS